MNEPQPESSREFAAPGPPDRVMAAEDVFLKDDEEPAPVAAGLDCVNAGPDHVEAAPPLVATRRPGPGIWESIGWMIGMHAVQIAAGVLVTVLIFARVVLTEGLDLSRFEPVELFRKLMSCFQDNFICFVGVAQAATIVYGLLAIQLRIRPRGVRRLGWQLPWLDHWLLVVLLVPPLCLLCSVLQNAMFQWVPSSEGGMKALMQSLAQEPLPLLVLVIGLGPALAEELVFRGLVGRGLVARWGLVRGMLVTSLLFGAMHINPAQAIAVIPLGFAMHFVYFTTRSFWAPVTLHCANNSLSVILLKQDDLWQVEKMTAVKSELPVPLLVAALAMIAAFGILLWRTRVQYVLRDGSVWNPGFVTTEAPGPEVDAVATRPGAGLLLAAVGLIITLGFVAALWAT